MQALTGMWRLLSIVLIQREKGRPARPHPESQRVPSTAAASSGYLTLITRKCEEVARDGRKVDDVGCDVEQSDQHQDDCDPSNRHGAAEDVDRRVCSRIVERGGLRR